MNILDKIGTGLAQSIDTIVDKNRQCAQLNRLSAVIRNETEALNRAYIALGKHYYKILEGNTEDTDVANICELIEASKFRLKKAQARYDYVQKYGVSNTQKKQPVIKVSPDEEIKMEPDPMDDFEEDEDITIAYSENSPAPQTDEKTAEEQPATEIKVEPATNVKKEKAETKEAEVVAELKKKHTSSISKKKTADTADTEAANDSDAEPIV